MTRRLALAAVAAVAAGCAQAGSPGEPIDASSGGKIDAHAVDAHEAPPADAPTMSSVCTTSATCATATMLAGIGGDEDGGSTSGASGYQAAWYSIRVSETDSGPFADPMSMQTTLTSPSGAMFDLFVYVNEGTDALDCSTPTGSVTTSGATETSNLEWGETGTFANDADDSRTVSIEVRPKSGDSCSPGATWSIAIITGFD